MLHTAYLKNDRHHYSLGILILLQSVGEVGIHSASSYLGDRAPALEQIDRKEGK